MTERLDKVKYPKTVLAVITHKDDETYMAGTLHKLANAGHRVVIGAVTKGELGSRNKSPRKDVQARNKEFEAAAEMIGAADIVSLNYSEAGFNLLKVRRGVTGVVRNVNPDVVFTHYHDDYHPLHREVRKATEWAVFNAPATPYRTRSGLLRRDIPAIHDKEIAFYEMDPQGLKDSKSKGPFYDFNNVVIPEMVVQLTEEEVAVKVGVYDNYHSQKKLRGDDKEDYVHQILREVSVRGDIVPREMMRWPHYAEGFTQISYGGELFTDRNILYEMLPGEVYELSESEKLVYRG